jgi:hypothetical protein
VYHFYSLRTGTPEVWTCIIISGVTVHDISCPDLQGGKEVIKHHTAKPDHSRIPTRALRNSSTSDSPSVDRSAHGEAKGGVAANNTASCSSFTRGIPRGVCFRTASLTRHLQTAISGTSPRRDVRGQSSSMGYRRARTDSRFRPEDLKARQRAAVPGMLDSIQRPTR